MITIKFIKYKSIYKSKKAYTSTYYCFVANFYIFFVYTNFLNFNNLYILFCYRHYLEVREEIVTFKFLA